VSLYLESTSFASGPYRTRNQFLVLSRIKQREVSLSEKGSDLLTRWIPCLALATLHCWP